MIVTSGLRTGYPGIDAEVTVELDAADMRALVAGKVVAQPGLSVVAEPPYVPFALQSPAPLRLRFKKLHPAAAIPSRANPGDAGLDLVAAESVTLWPGRGPVKVRTGIAADTPGGWFVLFRDRSSLAAQGVAVVGGVMDSGYTGEWVVVLNVTGKNEVEIKAGDRIAQALVLPVPRVELVEVAELPSSARGVNGFGSTGR